MLGGLIGLVYAVGAGVRQRSGREPVAIPIPTDPTREDLSPTQTQLDWYDKALNRFNASEISVAEFNLIVSLNTPEMDVPTRLWEDRRRSLKNRQNGD